MGDIKIKLAIVLIIGLVIWYGVLAAINTDTWDSGVKSMLTIVPIVLVAAVVLGLLGFKLGGGGK